MSSQYLMMFFIIIVFSLLIISSKESDMPLVYGTPTIATISAGDNPLGVGVNTVTNMIYVANGLSNTVSVINGTNNQIVATISVGGGPNAIGVNPVTNKIYVANNNDNSISIINGTGDTVVKTITVGTEPRGVGVNPVTNKVYVANWGQGPVDGTVSVIDGLTDTVVNTIDVGSGPGDVGVNPVTNKIYISNGGNFVVGDTVSEIDGSTDTVVNTISVDGSPHEIAVNPVTNKIYVAIVHSAATVIDGNTNNVTKFATGNSFSVGVDGSTNTIFEVNCDTGTISVMSGITNNVTDTIKIGTCPSGIAVNNVTHLVYVTVSSNSGALGKVYVTSSTPLPSPIAESNANLDGTITDTGCHIIMSHIDNQSINSQTVQVCHHRSYNFKIATPDPRQGCYQVKTQWNESETAKAYVFPRSCDAPLFYNASRGVVTGGWIFSYASDPPLIQMKYQGVSAKAVDCANGLQLIIKESDKSANCVTSETAKKLLERAWGSLPFQTIGSQFITKEDAINIVHEKYSPTSISYKQQSWINFAFLKFNGTQSNYPQFIEYKADQNSSKISDKVGTILFNKFQYYISDKKIDRFVWVLPFSGGLPSYSIFIDARTGEPVGVWSNCPMCICLAGNSVIDTPHGPISIKELHKGMMVWTQDQIGQRQVATILKIGKTLVPTTHKMIHIVLEDGRELYASSGHPTADGRFLGELSTGDNLDNVKIKTIELVSYNENYTYDILPSGTTGFYWANGILVGSTLK